ncbi:energy-coupling factor ABC transporter substrate-binding protein [Kineosporia sp. J2-2]|uniref:Cobalt transport protein CbiN n=1 Tax=Kineosporia corallincola TaxID=2835133 RepID=A0ABS5TLN0_9ACTN|nr:energy-coupling factor ABC transporter substrate-binding protein [Kineosporia corallincola]MBT0772002.1 energy-coupling factor ABC transporter substrate-binding protein [Kineosporia corallincola]
MRNRRRLTVDLAILLLVVAIFAIPLALRLNTAGQAEGESYAGSDSSAATKVEEINPGYHVWFSPLFEPSSGEVESGLFALQAAAGAGVLGFALGRLSGRRRRAGESDLSQSRAG